MDRSLENKNIFIIFGLIALFLVLRLAVLFSGLDKLYEPEELYRGTIARETIRGPLISLWEYLDYQVEYFPGGVLTVGILAVPFFLLFGQTYISLKLVGLLFALGTFIFWYIFLDKFFNRKTAVTCALLFIFCMPFYTKTSLITWGAHPEANFFTILSIYILYLIFFRDSRLINPDLNYLYKKNIKYFFLLGLIAGFSLWFVFTYLVTLLVIFLLWFTFDRRLLLRKVFYVFCIGFLLGFSPAVYYAILYKREIFNVNGQPIFINLFFNDLNNFFPKLSRLIISDLPQSFLFENLFGISGFILSYLYYIIFIFAFIYLLWLNRKEILNLFKSIIYPITLKEARPMPYSAYRESYILAYPLLFILSYSISIYSVLPRPWKSIINWPYYIGYRYMIPVIPFILAIVGIFIIKIKNNRLLFNTFLISVLSLGLIGNLSNISLKNLGRFFQDKGYSYNIIGDKIGLRVTHGLAEYIAPFEKLNGDLRFQFYEGLGAGIAWRLKNEDIKQVIKIIDTDIKPQYKPYGYRGWGTLFSPQYPEEFNRALYIANSIPVEYRPYFYEGFGRKIDFIEDIDRAIYFIKNIDNKIDKVYQPFFYMGLGYNIGFEFKHDPNKRLNLISRIDKKYQKFVCQGISLGIKER